jgi:hypothetical protein
MFQASSETDALVLNGRPERAAQKPVCMHSERVKQSLSHVVQT